MKQVEVLLNAPERALRFCNILSACEGPFDLGRGSYTVDGKSILGIFSLDLSKAIDLNIHDDDNMDDILKTLAPYIVE